MVETQGSAHRYERAVVIGASMAGLAVARALSDHFREVVLIERDALSLDKPGHRPGVAQSWHIHNLYIGGKRELETMFPGFDEAATALGAVHIDDMADFATHTKSGWGQRVDSDLICMSATRSVLEFAERQRFFALVKNARLLRETRVMDLLIDKPQNGRPRVTGVATNHPDEPKILADLVVDCSGRAMGWKNWFKQHGVPLPKETVVDSRCGYSSRFYRPRNPAEFSWKGMIIGPGFPDRPHWGVIIPIENNDWVVTLGGFDGNYPPADEEGFMAFARALPATEYAQALERAEPLTKVRAFRKLEMRWNHFESFDGLSRFMAIGDSAWAYNPLYGQGMSVAVTCSRILRDVLSVNNDLDTLPRRYYRPALKFALPLWSSTAQLDLRWPGAIGKRQWHSKLTGPAAELAVRAASSDQVVNRALLEVAHLIKPPMAALTLNVMARVAFYALKELFFGPPKFQPQMQLPPPGRLATPLLATGTATCCACGERPCCCDTRAMTA
jgi:flavin-dependent dehydrogenase